MKIFQQECPEFVSEIEKEKLNFDKLDYLSDLYLRPLLSKNIEVHYLGYYEKWHPQSAYYYSIENGNFKSAPERNNGTFSTYSS